MQRRQFLQVSGMGAAALATFPHLAFAKEKKEEPASSAPWRTVNVTTKISLNGEEPGKLWIPLPRAKTSYQESSDFTWTGNLSRGGFLHDATYGAPVFLGEFEKAGPVDLTLNFTVRLRDRSGVELVPASDAAPFLQPTAHVPTDGSVLTTAKKITGAEKNSDRKARAIYEWMVENTARDPKVRGCGQGDVKAMLDSGNLEGKCADLSSLYVALCRASGVPAREVFGLRLLPSALSKSLGKDGDVSGGQHCRAEYYSAAKKGWVPVDPADVRKVILEESRPLADAHVEEIRRKLFGSWEMNWMAYNSARDFKLPPAPGEEINYLMYPYYEAGAVKKDGMDPKAFTYTIHAQEA